MVQRIRTSIALLKSIIDKSAELHGENADPVIMLVDTNEVIHYEIYPFEQPNTAQSSQPEIDRSEREEIEDRRREISES